MFCMINYKSLKREDVSGSVQKAEGEGENSADLGKIINIMQSDTMAVAQRFWDFSGIVTAPIRIAIAFMFLYSVLGRSAFGAVFVVCVAWLLSYPLGPYSVKVSLLFLLFC